MLLYDAKFDGGNGDAELDLVSGNLVLKISDKNPNFPSGGQINIPLSQIVHTISLKVNNSFVTFLLNAVLTILDSVT